MDKKAWKDQGYEGKDTEIVIMDAPARVEGRELAGLVKRVETIIIPVLPSPIDIRAGANFIKELLTSARVSRKETKVAVVANRVRENTLSYHALYAFLKSLKHSSDAGSIRKTS